MNEQHTNGHDQAATDLLLVAAELGVTLSPLDQDRLAISGDAHRELLADLQATKAAVLSLLRERESTRLKGISRVRTPKGLGELWLATPLDEQIARGRLAVILDTPDSRGCQLNYFYPSEVKASNAAPPKRKPLPPFPATWCSTAWCLRPVRWYLDLVAYCDACWRKLGFYDPWKHDQGAVVAEEVTLARPRNSEKPHGLGCPEWLTPGDPEWDKQVAKNGIQEMRERRAAWLREQEREEKAG